MKPQQFKERVKDYWNHAACGTEFIDQSKYSKEYFEAVEDFRYLIEPEIFSFAQFTRFRDKKVLEVGTGAGSDFLQWVRAGAQAHGIDLTQESIDHVRTRLALYNLEAHDVRVADAESLPHEDNTFDLVYSWGVIHHSHDIEQCLREIVRVTKPGGKIKVMVYNRRSLFAFYQYLRFGVLRGRPFQSFQTILYNHQESYGTKALTRKELKALVSKFPVALRALDTTVSNHDLLYYASSPVQGFARFLATLLGWQRVGWFMRFELEKLSSRDL
ncbi:MAG: class I SAM-dependent methyltransferase [Epsilonproteobacteria bacterium]|nr:class I SAM-dependent methyltransferase [Campylobacterota bacterium]